MYTLYLKGKAVFAGTLEECRRVREDKIRDLSGNTGYSIISSRGDFIE